VAVALGIVGLYLAAIVYGSFAVRSRLGVRRWRALHVLSFPAFVLITLHGILAGSDGGSSWLQLLYLTSAGLVLWLTLYRGFTVIAIRQVAHQSAQAR
jgi:DMSO/TMAO reductase YedYZ heme-binding membrane subunit